MKKLFTFLIGIALSAAAMSQTPDYTGYIATVSTTSRLATYKGLVKVIIVTDNTNGGMFKYYTGTDAVDGINVFAGFGAVKWKRAEQIFTVHLGPNLQTNSAGDSIWIKGDVATPAASSYWGTNGSGTVGWFTLPTGGTGVTTMQAIGSSPNSNGATISTVNLTLQPADGNNGGVLKPGTQYLTNGAKQMDKLGLGAAASANNLLYVTKSSGSTAIARFEHTGSSDATFELAQTTPSTPQTWAWNVQNSASLRPRNLYITSNGVSVQEVDFTGNFGIGAYVPLSTTRFGVDVSNTNIAADFISGHFKNTGTYDASASARFAYGVRGEANATRSAGTNALINVGGYFSASNGITNVALWSAAGLVRFDLGSDATGDVFYRNSSGYLTRLAIGTTSQYLQGGTVPSFTTPPNLYNADGTLTGARTVTLSGNNLIFDATSTGKLRFNFSGSATGDLLYRDASGNQTRLGIGSTNQVLTVASGLPSWKDISTVIGAVVYQTEFTQNAGASSVAYDIPTEANSAGELEAIIVGKDNDGVGSVHYMSRIKYDQGSVAPTIASSIDATGPTYLSGLTDGSVGYTGISSPFNGVRLTLFSSATQNITWHIVVYKRNVVLPF